jgi:myo-inositol-1(or 4)-monophosphatase
MRKHLHTTKRVNEATRHDIKLELDVRCQKLIENALLKGFPDISVVGEEGSSGDPNSERRWIVDPIDGTVNFTYGIPHACVSIALQQREDHAGAERGASRSRGARRFTPPPSHTTFLGVIYDPFTDELWTALRGEPARLNGRMIHVSSRRRLKDSILTMGFAKSEEVLKLTLPFLNRIVGRIRKLRIMGSAALGLAYVASGRLDAYVEAEVRLWDVAAGALLIECAGGEFWHQPIANEPHAYRMIASNGLLRREIQKVARPF